jgi:hypothetical protein
MIGLAYGLLAYAVFLGTFLYTIGFVEGFVVGRTIDSGPPASSALALAVDCSWFVLFAVQHSGMARASFKRRWTRIVPARAERSTYVLVSAMMFVLLIAIWRPIPTLIWRIDAPAARYAIIGLSLAGWGLVCASCSTRRATTSHPRPSSERRSSIASFGTRSTSGSSSRSGRRRR